MIPDENMQRQIDDYWQNHRHCTHLRKHASPELLGFLEKQVKEHPWFETQFNALSFAARHIYEPVRCKACGKILRLDNAREHKEYCSVKCSTNSNEIKEKTRRTMQERYGCDAPAQCREIWDRQRATMKERYGAEYTLSSKVLVEKQTRTVLEKYGVDRIGKSKEVHDRIRNTLMEKYGVDHYAKTDEFREQSSILNRKRGYALLERWKDYVVPLFSEEEFVGMFKRSREHIEYRWKCVQCGNEFTAVAYRSGFHNELGSGYMPRCPHCHHADGGISTSEKEVLEYVKSIYDGEIIENSKHIINGLELDMYIPDKKTAIEFDGLYWHSEEKGKGVSYHVGKTELCERNGIRLVHIFEDDWLYRNEIVKDRIASILGLVSNRIYARKCEVREIDGSLANSFLNENHLQGGDNSTIRYGLFYNERLVEVMTFGKPRFNGNYDYELIRNASAIGVNVIGGFSKLLAYFVNRHHGSTIISYADRRYSNGNVYDKNGFSFVKYTSPNYWWCKNKHKYSRYQCQKGRLAVILGDKFDESLSENDNMLLAGFDKIYDCGNIVYVYGERK